MKLGTLLVLILAVMGPLASGQEKKEREKPRTDLRAPEKPRVPDASPQGFRGQYRKQEERARKTSVPATVGGPSSLVPRSPQIQQLEPVIPQQGRQVKEESRKIFSSVQQGLSSGNISTFSQHMGSQVYVNLRGGESGYYSANQAYYLLENYFKTRRLVNFNFSTIGESESNPYATGSAGFNEKGSRERAQVYVSLSLAGNRWVITQINIY